MKLAHAIELATHDYRAVIGESDTTTTDDLTARYLVDIMRRALTRSEVANWRDIDHAIDGDTAEAYHDVLDASPAAIDAALTVMQP